MKQRKIFTVLLLLLCLVGCSSQPSIKGKWVLSSVEKEGKLITGDELHTLYGGEITYSFEKNNVLTVEMIGQTEKGTWEEKGDQVTIRYYDQELVLKVKDGKMRLEQNGSIFTLEQQKK